MIAKRGKAAYPVDYTLRDLYDKYKREVPKDIKVEWAVFNKVMQMFGEKLINKILNESAEVKLPCNLGTLMVEKAIIRLGENMNPDGTIKKHNSLKIDWVETNRLGKYVYHLNEHRNGYRYKFHWHKGKVSNIGVYALIPLRIHKRRLAKILKTQPERDYFEKREKPKSKWG